MALLALLSSAEVVLIFVIAHRLSTVRDADRILVLEGGRLVAHGPVGHLICTLRSPQRSSAGAVRGQA